MALAVPLLVAVVAIAGVSAGEVAGATPWAGLVPRNSAEAAAIGDASDLLRLLRRGDDSHTVYDIRPEVISSAVLKATTLEAAIWSRQLELIQLLDREGIIQTSDRNELSCLAADLKVDDLVEYLAPEGARCDPGKAIALVAARSRQPAS